MNNKVKIVLLLIIFISTSASALEMLFHGRVDEVYDETINPSSEDSDWITNLMLGIDLKSEGRSLEYNLTGNVYQQYSPKNDEKNRNFQDVTLSIRKSFSENFSINTADVFQHYPETRSFGTLFGRSDTSAGYVSNNFSAGLSAYATKELFFDAVYHNNIMNNDSNTMVDTVLHNPGVILGYYFNSANIVRTGYIYSLMKYDVGTQSIGHRVYGEYEKFYASQIRSIFQGGYDYITSNEGQSGNQRWMASIIDDVDKNNQLDISFLKENTISNISNDIFDSWKVSGSLRREISERIGINISIFYGMGTYQISRVSDKLAGASVSVSFTVTEFVNFNMGYAFTWNSTITPNVNEAEYKRNQVSVGLSAIY